MAHNIDPNSKKDQYAHIRPFKLRYDDMEYTSKYLNFRIVASRYNTGDIDSFVHRFKEGNDMCLEEDANAAISMSIVNKQMLIKDRIAEKKYYQNK